MLDKTKIEPTDMAYVNKDQVTREERMRAFEPYPDYYSRRLGGALLIAGITLAAAALAEYFGFDTKPVRAVVGTTGPFMAPACLGTLAGTTRYVTRRD